MKKTYINAIMIIALMLIPVGILISFVDLGRICINSKNDGYVGSIFALSGVFLYFSALMYQIKEYKLQVKELKKSVKAQTNSSIALEEQKKVLIEQNLNNLIFGMIDRYNDFKERNDTYKIVDELTVFYRNVFAERWKSDFSIRQASPEQINIDFALEIKNILNDTIQTHNSYPTFKRYIQIAYNILYIIDINKDNFTKDHFTSFFFSQLGVNESVMLYLSNLVDLGMPLYSDLNWNFTTTEYITDLLRKKEGRMRGFDLIDQRILTEQFNKLKQK